AKRSFFGVLRVRLTPNDPRQAYGPYTNLTHGTTLHGQNYVHPDLARMPTTYYMQTGPGGRVMEFYNWFKDDVRELVKQARETREKVFKQAKTKFGEGWEDHWLSLWRETKIPHNAYRSDARMPAALAALGASQIGVSNLPLAQMCGAFSEPPYATI